MKFLVLIISVIALGVLNLFVGSVNLPAADVASVIFGGDDGSVTSFIVFDHRLPMTVTALLSGASHAAARLLIHPTLRKTIARPSGAGFWSGS